MKRYFSKSNIDLLERVPNSLLIVAACFFVLDLVGILLTFEFKESSRQEPVSVSVISENQESVQQESGNKRNVIEHEQDKQKKRKKKSLNLNKIEPVSVSVISENKERGQQEVGNNRNETVNEKVECNQIDQVNSLGIRQ